MIDSRRPFDGLLGRLWRAMVALAVTMALAVPLGALGPPSAVRVTDGSPERAVLAVVQSASAVLRIDHRADPPGSAFMDAGARLPAGPASVWHLPLADEAAGPPRTARLPRPPSQGPPPLV